MSTLNIDLFGMAQSPAPANQRQARIRCDGGVAFVAHDLRDVMRELDLGVPA